MPDYDLIIRNGSIIDGTGAPARSGDVAISGDRIEAVGARHGQRRRARSTRAGCAVAPGLRRRARARRRGGRPRPARRLQDHAGRDDGRRRQLRRRRRARERRLPPVLRARLRRRSSARRELPWSTTAEYFAAVDAAHPACNVAAYVPQGVVRIQRASGSASGASRRTPNWRRCSALVEEAMQAGAIGMSTGLVYVPGAYAQTPELIELAKVVAKYGGIYTSHIRNEGAGVLAGGRGGDRDRRAVRLPGADLAPQGGGRERVRADEAVAAVHRRGARARRRRDDRRLPVRGVVVVAGGDVPRRPRARRSSASPAIIASVKYNNEKYEGRYISDIAAELDLPIGDAIRKILHDEENTPSVIMFIMDEADVRRVVADDHCMIGSDGLPSGRQAAPAPLRHDGARAGEVRARGRRCCRSRRPCAR